MNEYRVVPAPDHTWAIEWLIDGVSQGVMVGRYCDRAEATYAVYQLALLEYREGARTTGNL